MSLYNQILAYIEGENAADTAAATVSLERSEVNPASSHESLDKDAPASSPESLVTSSPRDESLAPVDKEVDKDASDEDKNMLVTGGKLLSETVDNLTGGGMGKKESVKTPPPVKKDVDPNLFEGGAVLVTDQSEARNMDENGVRGRYTEFLHRLRTPKLFSGGSMNNSSTHSPEHESADTVCMSEANHESDTAIDVLPVFPYLIRY